MRAMVSSVKDKGVTQPAIVRPREDGGYEIVSGHRRQKASELAGYANLTNETEKTKIQRPRWNKDNENQRRENLHKGGGRGLKQRTRSLRATDQGA